MSGGAGPLVIKIGGELLAREGVRRMLSGAIAELWTSGMGVVLVHGGGPQASALERALGSTPRVVAGRRITDAVALEAVKMALAGSVNTDLVAALGAHGVPAVGLTGADGGLLVASRRPPRAVTVAGQRRTVDFGLVGDIVRINPSLLRTLAAASFVPALCSLAATPAGEILNVNADTVAAEVAVALGAERLLVLGTTAGVFGPGGTDDLLRELAIPDVGGLVARGIATDGMEPKLTACARAVTAGVPAVILNGADAAAVLRAARGGAAGTRIVAALDAPSMRNTFA
jgi:acetylglutamate kinase